METQLSDKEDNLSRLMQQLADADAANDSLTQRIIEEEKAARDAAAALQENKTAQAENDAQVQ